MHPQEVQEHVSQRLRPLQSLPRLLLCQALIRPGRRRDRANCVALQSWSRGRVLEPPRAEAPGILPLVMAVALTTKRVAPTRSLLTAQWPSWDHCDATPRCE